MKMRKIQKCNELKDLKLEGETKWWVGKSTRETLYIRCKNWGRRVRLLLYIPVQSTLRREQGPEQLMQMWSHLQCQTQLHPLCASTYGQTLQREHFFILLHRACQPNSIWKCFGNIFLKIFSVLFSPSGYADCAKCAVNEACGIPYVLLMKTDLISTFSCHSELFECCGVVLLSLKRAPSPSAFLHVKACTANDLTCLCRVTHPKLLYHQPLAFGALSALNLALYHLSLGISYQFFKEIASIGIFSRH